MRITRMLVSLGELGFEHLKPPFIKFIFEEIDKKTLVNCEQSCVSYWLPTLQSDAEHESFQDKDLYV